MTSSKSLLFVVLGLLTGCLLAIVVNAQEPVIDLIVPTESLLDAVIPIKEVPPPLDIIIIPNLNEQIADLK